MPLGIQRLNAKKSQPNPRIVFIKSLKGPNEKVAQDFLERIAAQCLPIMKEHSLSVTTLEEYEPNREFVGRNFNAGEVVQLVLRSPSDGRWLPFSYVQMVMMHELAHCKQMNHSRAFWAVRNRYADQMRVLWNRGYTGEGLWGPGASLATGEFEFNASLLGDDSLPEHLCGGTYRSRGRKRKAKPQLSYQERKERRIRNKFGVNGQTLGEDEDVKAQLEKGKRTQARPRVAGSSRGRELRAAAALARFGDQKKKQEGDEEDKESCGDEEESETESDQDEDDVVAVDANGRRLVDGKGHGLVKVCEDEDPENDDNAKNELRELLQQSAPPATTSSSRGRHPPQQPKKEKTAEVKKEKKSGKGEEDAVTIISSRPKVSPKQATQKTIRNEQKSTASSSSCSSKAADSRNRQSRLGPPSGTCKICSFDSGPGATSCAMCANVLDPDRVPDSWSCTGSVCAGSPYMNAGDAGLCGVCGEKRR